MTRRVTLLRAQCARRPPAAWLLEEIEDVLSAGYAEALAGDAWSTSSEEHLQQLIGDADQLFRARRLRMLASEHARFQRELVALRRELAELRRDRDRLCLGSGSRSAR